MNGVLQATAIIRQRGQLTIPDQIRGFLSWIIPNSVVTITIGQNEEIIVKPYAKDKTKKIDWKGIWERIEIADSFWGKRGNLSKFIVEDRDRRR